MTTINLKDFYYWYLTDELVEVPDEVAEELMASKRREAAHAERVRYPGACKSPAMKIFSRLHKAGEVPKAIMHRRRDIRHRNLSLAQLLYGVIFLRHFLFLPNSR